MNGCQRLLRGLDSWLVPGVIAAVVVGCGAQSQNITQAGFNSTTTGLQLIPPSIGKPGIRGGSENSASSKFADAVEVPLHWSGGLPHVMAKLNGHPVNFILDTGSQGTVLEADTAARCGVSTTPASSKKYTISGANGSEPALRGQIRKIEIGDWHWEDAPCLVRTQSGEIAQEGFFGKNRVLINVLGMDVLQRMCSHVTIDYPARKVVFGFGKKFHPEGSGRAWNVPMELRDGLPMIRMSDGRNQWSAVVDTGSAGCVEISRDVAGSGCAGILRQSSASPVVRVGVGIEAQAGSSRVRSAQIPSLELLCHRLPNAPVLIVPDCSKIGSGVLRGHRVTLDFRHSVLWMEQPPR